MMPDIIGRVARVTDTNLVTSSYASLNPDQEALLRAGEPKKFGMPPKIADEIMAFLSPDQPMNQAFLINPTLIENRELRERLFDKLQQYVVASLERRMLMTRHYFEDELGVKSTKLRDKPIELSVEHHGESLGQLVTKLDEFSHELKTPVTAVTGMIQMHQRRVRKGEVTEESERETVEKVFKNWKRLYTFCVEQSQFLQGDKPVEMSTKSFASDLQGTLRMYANLFQRSTYPLDIKLDAEPGKGTVCLTQSTMGHIGRNIISNVYNVLSGMEQVEEDPRRLKSASKMSIRVRQIWGINKQPYLFIDIRDRLLGYPPNLAQKGEFDGYHGYDISNIMANANSTGIGMKRLQTLLRDQGALFRIGNYQYVDREGQQRTGASTRIAIPLYE